MSFDVPVGICEWSDPPPSVTERARNEFDGIADELMERPGEWAVVARGATSAEAKRIRRQLAERLGCEVRGTKTGPDELDVRARWVPA